MRVTIAGNSYCLDYIHTAIIKQCSAVFFCAHCSLDKSVLLSGHFSLQVLVRLYYSASKKPDPTVPANFRPISNLNNISKILERLFLTRLQPNIASSTSFLRDYSPLLPALLVSYAITALYCQLY